MKGVRGSVGGWLVGKKRGATVFRNRAQQLAINEYDLGMILRANGKEIFLDDWMIQDLIFGYRHKCSGKQTLYTEHEAREIVLKKMLGDV